MLAEYRRADMSELPEVSEFVDLPTEIDTSQPHIARMYDYYLGGKNHFAADRELADKVIAAIPGMRTGPRENREFLGRAVRFLAGEAGISQFLDIGTGLPTASNTHQVAQTVAADSRIVYVDNDPIVLLHARSLLASTPAGATAFIDADLRDTREILAMAAQTLDFSQPVAVMLLIVLHLIPNTDDPYGIVTQLMGSLAPGSHLVISHPADDIRPAAMAEMTRRVNARLSSARGTMRDRGAITRFFDGLELVDPGVVQPQEWRPAGPVGAADVTAWCGVARKA
jgi:hypothetical protein